LVNRYSTSQQIATRARIILADDGQNHRHSQGVGHQPRYGSHLASPMVGVARASCHHLKDCRMQSAVEHQRLLVWSKWLNCLRLPVLSPVITDELSAIGQKENWRMRWSSSASWSISPRHVGRLLQEAQLKPHQIRYWLTPGRRI